MRCSACSGCWTPLTLPAHNVDLATVPERSTVQLTIYNSEDLTLVGNPGGDLQTRRQPLQFSLGQHPDRPYTVDLAFSRTPNPDWKCSTPPSRTTKPQTLYWNVQSDADREATIEISYFTSGISWAADYLCDRRSR